MWVFFNVSCHCFMHYTATGKDAKVYNHRLRRSSDLRSRICVSQCTLQTRLILVVLLLVLQSIGMRCRPGAYYLLSAPCMCIYIYICIRNKRNTHGPRYISTITIYRVGCWWCVLGTYGPTWVSIYFPPKNISGGVRAHMGADIFPP